MPQDEEIKSNMCSAVHRGRKPEKPLRFILVDHARSSIKNSQHKKRFDLVPAHQNRSRALKAMENLTIQPYEGQ